MRHIALVAILALVSCSGGGPSSPSSPALTGTWRIQSYLMTPQPFQAFPPPELTYHVTFDGSRLSARLDCNTCNGSFTQTGSSLVIEPALACTRAACTYEFVNRDIVTILAGPHEMSERLGHVTLRSERGTIILSPQ